MPAWGSWQGGLPCPGRPCLPPSRMPGSRNVRSRPHWGSPRGHRAHRPSGHRGPAATGLGPGSHGLSLMFTGAARRGGRAVTRVWPLNPGPDSTLPLSPTEDKLSFESQILPELTPSPPPLRASVSPAEPPGGIRTQHHAVWGWTLGLGQDVMPAQHGGRADTRTVLRGPRESGRADGGLGPCPSMPPDTHPPRDTSHTVS